MARRKQLRGLAQNLAQWSLSRNFDYVGYWAIGKIYLYCKDHGLSDLTISVLEGGERLGCEELPSLDESFLNILDDYLSSNSMPRSWIMQLRATYKFEQEYQGKYHYYGSAIGKPFICLIEITTDLGRLYYAETGANCRAHDPRRESRRSGF